MDEVIAKKRLVAAKAPESALPVYATHGKVNCPTGLVTRRVALLFRWVRPGLIDKWSLIIFMGCGRRGMQGGATAAYFRSIPNKSQDSLGGTANTADSKSVSNGISVRIR